MLFSRYCFWYTCFNYRVYCFAYLLVPFPSNFRCRVIVCYIIVLLFIVLIHIWTAFNIVWYSPCCISLFELIQKAKCIFNCLCMSAAKSLNVRPIKPHYTSQPLLLMHTLSSLSDCLVWKVGSGYQCLFISYVMFNNYDLNFDVKMCPTDWTLAKFWTRLVKNKANVKHCAIYV